LQLHYIFSAVFILLVDRYFVDLDTFWPSKPSFLLSFIRQITSSAAARMYIVQNQLHCGDARRALLLCAPAGIAAQAQGKRNVVRRYTR
jgi:hypothetical protein